MRLIELRNRLVKVESTQSHEYILSVNGGLCKVQEAAKEELASLLTTVLCQALVLRADGSGRIAAVEIMMVNAAIRNLIRESKLTLIANAIRVYGQSGSLHQSVYRLSTILCYGIAGYKNCFLYFLK